MEEVDRERTEKMAAEMFGAVKANYLQGPLSRNRSLEALNACAFVVATIIAGTGSREGRQQARKFFDKALAQNVTELVDNPPRTVGLA